MLQLNEKKMKPGRAEVSAVASGSQMVGEDVSTHLCHFEDALWIQAASAHLPRAGDRALVRDRDDEAGHRAGLLLQSRIHHVSVPHLQNKRKQCMFYFLWDYGLQTFTPPEYQQVILPYTR